MAPGSLNKVCLIGTLGVDPQTRRTTNGKFAAVLNVMTSDYWRPGEARTQWHRVVIFNERLAELAQRHLKKGSKVYCEGALETRKWLTKDGKGESHTSEVIVSGFHGRLTLLDDAPETRGELADEPDAEAPPPTPEADKIDNTLSFLAPDDHQRAERRAAGELDRRPTR